MKFDPVKHLYTSDAGIKLPAVTYVLSAVLGEAIWNADPWYLDRGHAVHACAAFIAQGKSFDFDPAIAGQVAACRKFFADVKPKVVSVEHRIYHPVYLYAGTADMIAVIDGKLCVVDWKASYTPISEIQVGAYALPEKVKYGMIVELKVDGNYKATKMFKTERRAQEFIAVLSVYGIKKRLGLINEEG